MPNNNTQTITYDDFERSLIEDGYEIEYPGEDGELPVGIGGSEYSPRLTAPSQTNPYYLKNGYGGYNRCILITGKSCLPNCVGFAHGRLLEIGGMPGDKKLPTCNAEDWLATAKNNGLKTGNAPRLGAVIVWKSGNLWSGADGCGHVGVVEAIDKEGAITVSQSNYGGTRFFTTKHLPPYNITGQTFIGFVYNPYIVESGWIKDETGWKYKNADGSYMKKKWAKISGKWYYFNDKGYMCTGWLTLSNGKFYLGDDGAARTGWQTINNKRYYFDKDCFMKTGWAQVDSKWYYLDKNGVMASSKWVEYKGGFYFVGNDGAMFVGKHNVPVYFDKNGKFVGNPL